MTSSSRRKFIICLDSALLLIFLLLLAPTLTGLVLHEVLGLLFFIPLIIHLLISWSWIRKSVSKFFRNSNRAKFNFALNSILFILVITELVSGSLISEVALPTVGIKTINDSAWRAVHNVTLNFTVIFLALHIALNWGWIAAIFRKALFARKPSTPAFSAKATNILARTGIILIATGLVALILYGIVGEPSAKRIYSHGEVERFTPTIGHGFTQFAGEALLIAIYVFVARRWLRIRL